MEYVILEDIDATINVNLNKKIKIDNLGEIIQQDIPELKYNTKTTISMNGYDFVQFSSYHKYLDILLTHPSIGILTLKKYNLPNIICNNYIDKQLILVIENASNFESIIFNGLLLLELNSYENSITKNEKITVESITKKALNIPTKQLLKMLEEIDFKTFGPRYIKGKIRPYSGLAQKTNQRVVPITEQEYDILKEKYPESVINIQNQTTGQRLCLYCPYRISPFLNFHYSLGETCIPKCTLKQSNPRQYDLCAQQLNIIDKKEFKNRIQ